MLITKTNKSLVIVAVLLAGSLAGCRNLASSPKSATRSTIDRSAASSSSDFPTAAQAGVPSATITK